MGQTEGDVAVKRILIAALLVLVLVAIAYVRAIYSNQEDSKSKSMQAVHDSLIIAQVEKSHTATQTQLIDSLRRFYIDSVYKALTASDSIKAGAATANLDSLRHELADANKTIDDLRKGKDKQLQKYVNTIYAAEMATLPADLSDYEKSVSIKEVKEKLKKYFGLSPETLDRLLKNK